MKTREELIKEALKFRSKVSYQDEIGLMVDFAISQQREIVYPEKTNDELEEIIYSCAIERTMLGGCFLNRSNVIELVLKIKQLNKEGI